MKLLILGGSGQLSGRVAALALARGDEVWTLTRGQRPVMAGVHALTADRNDDAQLAHALAQAGVDFDGCIDCTAFTAASAWQCREIVSRYVRRFVIVSTDSVYDPCYKTVPQDETNTHYLSDGSYGANKRAMEAVWETCDDLDWTILRPGHIFGAGFQAGCYPEHSRQPGLLAHIRAGKPLNLVGGGEFLIHPIDVNDLARALLDCLSNPRTHRQVYLIGGPDRVTNADYFRLLARLLGCEADIHAIPLAGYLEAHPQYSGHLCHRCYDLTKLREAGVPLPATSLEMGLREQIAWLDAQNS